MMAESGTRIVDLRLHGYRHSVVPRNDVHHLQGLFRSIHLMYGIRADSFFPRTEERRGNASGVLMRSVAAAASFKAGLPLPCFPNKACMRCRCKFFNNLFPIF